MIRELERPAEVVHQSWGNDQSALEQAEATSWSVP